MSSEEDSVKDAFAKVKHDVYSLYSQITSLKRDMALMNNEMSKVSEILSRLSNLVQDLALKAKNEEKQVEKEPKFPSFYPSQTPTDQAPKPAVPAYIPTTPTHLPTHFPYKNTEKQLFSSGNEGVPTDRQTIQQTDNSHLKGPIFEEKVLKTPQNTANLANPIGDAVKALDSLDSLKKEIRLKFKQLTDQEVLIFSTLYQMEEEQGAVDYKALAVKLKLTESSIRDYIGRLLQKGIPVEKQRVNNKKILLSISPGLKRIASLQTILHLRDL